MQQQGAESMGVNAFPDVSDSALQGRAFGRDHIIGVLHDSPSDAALALDLTEYDELIDSFRRQNTSLKDVLSDQDIKRTIFEITNGLVCLCGLLLVGSCLMCTAADKFFINICISHMIWSACRQAGLITSILDHLEYKLRNETFKVGQADDVLR